jgi:glycine cleavage system H protein
MCRVVVKVDHGLADEWGTRFGVDVEFMWMRGPVTISTVASPLSIRQPAVSAAKTSFYKRSNFVTHLPVDCVYSPSHFWLSQVDPGRWRVGFTKFATRMLGDIVDVQFEKQSGDGLASGEIVGSIEGFKAISDIYSVCDGEFVAANTALQQDVELVSREPYAGGWLYEVQGGPDAKCVPLDQYRALLDATIDRMLAKQADPGDEGP